MRLFEFAADSFTSQFITDLKDILRIQKGVADQKSTTQPRLSWEAVNQLLPPGYSKIDYTYFDKIYQQNPEAFKSIVTDYNEDGIDLNTKKQSEKPEDKIETGVGAPTVQQMASGGVKDYLSKL